ncbi:MAG: hypothetical protein OSA08_09585 [Arenicellales bacterium]|nr:hypothetical protein [Arenicellales bacterium]
MVIVTQTTKLLGLSMLIGLLIGFVFYLILPKQYETRALLEAGLAWDQRRNQADGFDTIPMAIAQVNTLKEQVFEAKKGFVRPYRFRYLRAQADPANARHLYIFLRADEPTNAQSELSRLLTEIIEDDRKIFLVRQRQLEEAIERKKNEHNRSIAQVRDLESDIAELTASDPSQAMLKWFEKQTAEKNRERFASELHHLTTIAVATAGKETRLLLAPTLPLQPYAPNLHYLLSIGLAFGMMVGLVVSNILRARERVAN